MKDHIFFETFVVSLKYCSFIDILKNNKYWPYLHLGHQILAKGVTYIYSVKIVSKYC